MPRVFIFTKDRMHMDTAAEVLREAGHEVSGKANYADTMKMLERNIYDTIVIGRGVHDEERRKVRSHVHDRSAPPSIVEHEGDPVNLPAMVNNSLVNLDLSE